MANEPAVNRFDHVRIGRRTFTFTGFAEVSAAYRAASDALGIGASRTPRCDIFDGAGRQTAYVSYNGRVWEFDPADPHGLDNSNLCLFDPRPGPGPGALPLERMAAAAGCFA